MNVLMLTQRFPYPPHRGDTLRAWHELTYLAQRHRVWLAALDTAPPNPNHLEHVRRYCADVAVVTRSHRAALLRGGLHLLGGGSLNLGYFHEPRLAAVLAAWSRHETFDAVLPFSIGMAPYVALVEARRRVLDLVDVDSSKYRAYARRSPGPRGWLYRLEAARLARQEQRWSQACDVTVLVNERERRKLTRQPHPPQTRVVPTCLPADATRTVAALPKRPIIGLVGSMFYPPNVLGVEWFGRRVWPFIRAARPDAEWWIVGAQPTARVRRWGREANVVVTGRVPDMASYLRRLRVVVNPVRGDLGVQSKTLVALGAGKACVVTPDVAGGLDFDGPAPFLIASIPDRFAAAVVRLLGDDQLANTLGQRGRAMVVRHFTPERQLAALEDALYDGTTPPPRPVSAGFQPAAGPTWAPPAASSAPVTTSDSAAEVAWS